MGKRDTKNITLGSGHFYLVPFTDEMPTVETICVEENRLGFIKGGAALEYTEEP